jgi:hypothetical protein
MGQTVEGKVSTELEYIPLKERSQLEEMFRYALDCKKDTSKSRLNAIGAALSILVNMTLLMLSGILAGPLSFLLAWGACAGVFGSILLLFESMGKHQSNKIERLSSQTSTLPFDDLLRVKASIQKGAREVIIYDRIVSMEPDELASAELEAQLALEEARELQQTIIDQRVAQRALSSSTKTNWD